jgi:hypothetical protein
VCTWYYEVDLSVEDYCFKTNNRIIMSKNVFDSLLIPIKKNDRDRKHALTNEYFCRWIRHPGFILMSLSNRDTQQDKFLKDNPNLQIDEDEVFSSGDEYSDSSSDESECSSPLLKTSSSSILQIRVFFRNLFCCSSSILILN